MLFILIWCVCILSRKFGECTRGMSIQGIVFRVSWRRPTMRMIPCMSLNPSPLNYDATFWAPQSKVLINMGIP